MKFLLLCFFIVTLSCVVCDARFFPQVGEGSFWEVSSSELAQDHPLNLKVMLQLRDSAELTRTLYRVSNPFDRENYGKHLTLDELIARHAPSMEAVEAALKWVSSEGIAVDAATIPDSRDYVSVPVSVAQVEALLDTELTWWEHSVTGRRVIRAAAGYHIPDALLEASFVDFVDGVVGFPVTSVPRQAEKLSPASYLSVTPDFLMKQYNLTEPTGPVTGNSQANVQFSPNFYSASDLQEFFRKYVPHLQGQTVDRVFGSTLGSRTSIESNLDIQYQMAIGQYVNTSIYYVHSTNNIEDDFVQWATDVNNQVDPPLSISISYGQYGGVYDNSTVQRLDQELQKLGVRGVSVLLASGDNGVGCKTSCSGFAFDFPSSPHLTMVGATQFESNGKETGATLSSGGFSEDYFTPSWQTAAVNAYFSSGVQLPPAHQYDRNGRGYPDVAAAGQDVIIVDGGSSTGVSGTSCSAPITSGIISLLNNQRLSQGKSPLGWLNPLLYAHPSAYKAITEGNNQKCRLTCCCEGFDCSDGWNPVTGFGVMDYPQWVDILKSLP